MIFQQDNAFVHKSKIIDNCFQGNQRTVLEWSECSPDLNYEQFRSNDYENRVFWGNLEEKLYEIWNEIDPDVVRNLYENYRNRLLDVKKS